MSADDDYAKQLEEQVASLEERLEEYIEKEDVLNNTILTRTNLLENIFESLESWIETMQNNVCTILEHNKNPEEMYKERNFKFQSNEDGTMRAVENETPVADYRIRMQADVNQRLYRAYERVYDRKNKIMEVFNNFGGHYSGGKLIRIFKEITNEMVEKQSVLEDGEVKEECPKLTLGGSDFTWTRHYWAREFIGRLDWFAEYMGFNEEGDDVCGDSS